jgi:hypothetical protein
MRQVCQESPYRLKTQGGTLGQAKQRHVFSSEFIYRGFIGWFLLGGILGAVFLQRYTMPMLNDYSMMPGFVLTTVAGTMGFVPGALVGSIIGFIKITIFPPTDGEEF